MKHYLRMLGCLGSLLLLMLSPAVAQQQLSTDNPVGIDFSYAGYESGSPIPFIAAVLGVHPSGGDDTALLQGAIDRVASMPMHADGFRGALLLSPGVYKVRGQLHLRESGVVLRGSKQHETTIVADGINRRSLIVVGEQGDPVGGRAVQIEADAAAGSTSLILESVADIAVGDRVLVRRPSTKEWIGAIGMSGLPGTFANQRLDWKEGSHDLTWDRVVVSIDPSKRSVLLDAPITMALDQRYGGGTLFKVNDSGEPRHVGIEDLTLESAYDKSSPKDEEHSWIAIQIDRVEDAWVQRVTSRHFVSSAVRVNWHGRRIAVRECRNEAPIAEAGGYRRQAFVVNGQQVLVYRSWSESGMNDFASGLLAAGPNVFLDCHAYHALGASGAFEGLAAGVLYERVHVPDSRLQILLDFSHAQGAGWTAVNSVLWNSTAQSVDALGPPGAPNFVVRSTASLFESQLLRRTGRRFQGSSHVRAEQSKLPPQFRLADIKTKPVSTPSLQTVEIVHGRFVLDGKTMWGPSQGEAWWRGDTSALTALQSTGSSISRFMPGVIAPGETEDLSELATRLKARNVITFQATPGLWYEHRRDAHTVERRDDGNVWAPFYEMPWARSGQGVAWDGLSRFDVSRYNPWYFERHRKFAEEAGTKGFVVLYELYNDHDVLEIGPHWIDYPWRPANNINDTGLPEPPPFKPHNRNDVGNEFFSTAYAPLRQLHRAYMLHTFDVLANQPNIIFSMAYQYAGSLEFEQFFQDVAREWEETHGTRIRIALITSKATTDSILNDAVRSKQIAIVDMRYWEYRPDGSLWSPPSGINKAFREQIQAEFPGYSDTPPATTPEQMYRETREYHDRYPDIALMPMENGAGPIPLLMGGAASRSALVGGKPPTPPRSGDTVAMAESAPSGKPQSNSISGHASPAQAKASDVPNNDADPDRVLDSFVQTYLAGDLMNMKPQDGWTQSPESTWTLAGGVDQPVLVYSLKGSEVQFTTKAPATQYQVTWFNPRSGKPLPTSRVAISADTRLQKPSSEAWLLLMKPMAGASDEYRR